MSKKSPQLRFEGFTDDWEERKLSEIGKIVTGNTPSTSNKGYYNGDFLFVSPADIQENRYVNKTTTTLTELGFKTGRLVPKGATLFVSIGSTIGKIGQSICDVITNQQINSVISFSDYDDDFIYTSILNSSTKIKQLAATQAVPIINKNEFGKSIIKIPSLEEQQKIGAFFKQLDDTIALHQRKLDLLKEQKKGYLQKMFPKNGAKVPELRFAGFADDWEQRKLSGIIEKLSGGASIKPTDYLEDGIRTIPKGAVNATGIADLSGSKYISEDFFEKNITSHAHTSNLVTSLRDLVPSAPNMGRIVRIEGDDEQFLMPQGVYKLELFEGMDEDFLISFSNSDKYRKIISAEKNGSTQVHIRNGEFLNIDINLPSEQIQRKRRTKKMNEQEIMTEVED